MVKRTSTGCWSLNRTHLSSNKLSSTQNFHVDWPVARFTVLLAQVNFRHLLQTPTIYIYTAYCYILLSDLCEEQSYKYAVVSLNALVTFQVYAVALLFLQVMCRRNFDSENEKNLEQKENTVHKKPLYCYSIRRKTPASSQIKVSYGKSSHQRFSVESVIHNWRLAKFSGTPK